MSTYTVSELIQRWKNGKIDSTQAIGHILQHLDLLSQRQNEYTSNTATLTATIEDLSHRVAHCLEQMPPPSQRRGKRGMS